MIPYGRQTIDDKDIRAVVQVLRSDWLTQGPKVLEFEEALCRYTGAKYAVVVSSGTAALHIACLAAGLGKGQEAMVPANTFVATANAVLYTGAQPVFADIDHETGNIDPRAIMKMMNRTTRAIIPVHFGGNPCAMEDIYGLAKKRKITIIEDACHALGAAYKSGGKWWKIGSCRHSDMTIFSFHPLKAITTAEGGAVLTNDKRLYQRFLKLRSHGVTKEPSDFENRNAHDVGPWYYEMQELGFNFRITDLQCALGVSQLKKADGFVRKRTRIAQLYRKAWAHGSYFDLPSQQNNGVSAWHLFPIRLKGRFVQRRKEMFCWLRDLGLGVQVHYIPVYWQPYYARLGYAKGSCPVAEDFYRREISLPLYPAMTSADVRRVIECVNKAGAEVLK
ncbi:MAG: UDP-4-amino-4,6-dideoxy-N-acetyl-beta-L-altrosamine transaminase [Candidatus Omnitrophica bacterium]|nr:UDP-4-amino-4,6-dideoxy-N-acetyl-beta-L-altrosamine transaminase [Candidatus Omnitrophota bacterium]